MVMVKTSRKLSKVRVPLAARPYTIYIGDDVLYDLGATLFAHAPRTTAFVISNPKIFSLYGDRLIETIKSAGLHVAPLSLPDGERYKTVRSAERLYGALIEHRAERSATIVALGGGVIGDVAGFVAATYLRGVRLVQVPTTLLAQVDSSIGGKVGVNHAKGKNLIGAFYQPDFVWVDAAMLDTLSEREFCGGLYEVVKYGVIADAEFFQRLEVGMPALRARDHKALVSIIRRCCEIKADVVSQDERESHRRMILNFGHTIGHALETVTSYRVFKHGEAVGWGMIAAARLAQRLDMISDAVRERIEHLVQSVGDRPPIKGLAWDAVLRAMQRDKKVKDGVLRFVLPHRLGAVSIRSDVPARLVREVLRAMLARGN